MVIFFISRHIRQYNILSLVDEIISNVNRRYSVQFAINVPLEAEVLNIAILKLSTTVLTLKLYIKV